jgi:hypothetical protein
MKPINLFFILILVLQACYKPADNELRNDFVNPPDGSRPGAFWCWLNGNMTKESITRDLEQMHQKGMGSAGIWDVRANSNTQMIPAGGPFLGDESAKLIKHAVSEGKRIGIKVGLIASSGWNAGGSWVTPDWASKSLYFTETRVDGGKKLKLNLPYPRLTEGCPQNADGIPVFSKEVAVLAVPWNNSRTIPEINKVLDISAGAKNGRLEWEAPAGKWAVLRFVCLNNGQRLIVPSPNSDGLFIDFFDPASTRRYLQYFMDRLGYKPGDSGPSYYEFDSMELAVGIPWSDNFPVFFRDKTGYDLISYLPLLAGWNSGEITDRFRYDFRNFVSDQFIHSHYETATDFLKGYNADLVAEAGGPGPPIWNTCPVDALKALGRVSVPRGEFWIKHRNMFLVKQIASASHIYNKTIVDAESFTTWRRWKDSPFDMKPIVDRAFCEGLNFVTLCNYASTNPEDGLPGRSLHAGADFNPGTTWWEKSRPFMDYLSRCSYMLQQGKFVADVCFYYGDQAPNFFPSFHDVSEKPRIPGLDRGYDYDVVNSDVILNRMSVKDGRIVLPDGMSYRVMLLTDQNNMPLEVLEKISLLVKEGATIVGRPPVTVPGLKDYPEKNRRLQELVSEMWEAGGEKVSVHSLGKGRVFRDLTLNQVLEEDGIVKDFSFTGEADIDYIHRTTGWKEIYFLRNASEHTIICLCNFRVEGMHAELWDPSTGKMMRTRGTAEKGVTRISIELPAHGSVFVVFNGKEDKSLPETKNENVVSEKTVEGSWKVFFPSGWGAPKETALDTLISWTESRDEGIKNFSGTATYVNKLTADEGMINKSIVIDLGEVRDVAEVFVNGRSAGILWKKPYRSDITSLLKKGENELKIEIVNMWVNRLTGDMQLPPEKRFCHTNHYFMTSEIWPGGDEPYRLQPAGLIGPVKILILNSHWRHN